MDVMKMEKMACLKEIENRALDLLKDPGKYYFCAGASTGSIPRDNEEALMRYRIQPRVLRNVSEANLKCEVLGTEVACPIGIAPTGFHFFAHDDAEIATAKGCTREGCIFILSSVSSTPIEDVAESLNFSPTFPSVWIQVYIMKDRRLTLDLIERAESCGLSGVVVTVDGATRGQWKNNLPDGFAEAIRNKYAIVKVPISTLQGTCITFEDLQWLKNHTKLPIIVKGIMNGQDALEAAKCGASAIYVSNHGGRQIHKVLPTVEVLEEIVEAVKGYDVDIFFDGGIRSGSDIFIALALGATAVFVGRPAIWGLTVGGEEGVGRVLQILKDELLSTMKLAGAKHVKDIHRSMVRRI